MRAVNLLPSTVTLSSRAKPNAAVIVAAAAPLLAGSLVIAGFAFERSSVTSARGRLAAVQAQVAALPPRATSERPADVALGIEQQSRRSALDQALTSRIPWDTTLVQLARVLPSDVWLTTLNLASPAPADATTVAGIANPEAFTIDGYTYSQGSVAALMTRLQLLPTLSDVTLGTTTSSTVGNKAVVQFTVNAEIAPSDERAGDVTLKTPQTALVVAPAVLALVIVGVGMFAVVLPQRSQVGALNQQLAAAEATLVAAHLPLSTHPAVGPSAIDLFRLMEAMPNNDEMPGILLDLSGLAKASAVTITSVRPSPRIPLVAGYFAIPIVVDVDGTYAGVTKLLRLMRVDVQETNGRLAVRGRLLITNQIALMSADGRTVQATLNLDAFDYGALPSATTTAGAPAGTGSTTTAATTTTASTTTATTTTTASGSPG